MNNSLKPSSLVLAILITGMLSVSIAYGQTRRSITEIRRMGPTLTRAPLQRPISLRPWSGLYFSQNRQRQLVQQRPYRFLQQQRLTRYQTPRTSSHAKLITTR